MSSAKNFTQSAKPAEIGSHQGCGWLVHGMISNHRRVFLLGHQYEDPGEAVVSFWWKNVHNTG